MNVKVEMLSVKGCLDCKAAIETLKLASIKSGVKFELCVYDIIEDKAIQLAIDNNLEAVPAFVIGGKAIDGPFFEEKELIEALKGANNV